MHKRIIRYIRASSWFILAVLLLTTILTSPSQLGPFGLTAWFSGLIIALTGISSLLLMRWKYGESQEGFSVSLRRGFLLSMWVVSILALSSLRQLGIRDIILLTILGLLIDFYMQRAQQ